MEHSILMIIGMAVAFVLGAFVRKPFKVQKNVQQPIITEEEKEKIKSAWDELLSYTGENNED